MDDEQRPPRISSNLRTAALRGGGSGVVAFRFFQAFPSLFTLLAKVTWEGGCGQRGESHERPMSFHDRVASCRVFGTGAE